MNEVTQVFRREGGLPRRRGRRGRASVPRAALALEAFGRGCGDGGALALADTLEIVGPRSDSPELTRPRRRIRLSESYQPDLVVDDLTVTSCPDVAHDLLARWRRRVLLAAVAGLTAGLLLAGWF